MKSNNPNKKTSLLLNSRLLKFPVPWVAGFPCVWECDQRWRAHAVHGDCQEDEAVKIILGLSGSCNPSQMCCEELAAWASLASQDCEVAWDSRAPRNLYSNSAQSRVSSEAGPGSCCWVILQAALGIHSSPSYQRNLVRASCENLRTNCNISLLLFEFTLAARLDLSSLLKSWASAMQTFTAFPLSACDSNYSSWPKQSSGSNPILNPFVFLKSLCSVETAKGKRYETLVLAGTHTLVCKLLKAESFCLYRCMGVKDEVFFSP